MLFLGRILLKTLTNAGALYLASRWISGFVVEPRDFWGISSLGLTPLVQSLIIGGLILALLNAIVRPVLKFFSFPFIILTFGLFHIVINLAVLYFADLLIPMLAIEGFKALFFGSLLIGIVNAIM